ncbi:MAG: hypothetical protein ACK5Q5_19170 [Planctomycetaceae bacterium]
MDAAIRSAQSTLWFFEQNWKSMPNNGDSLKFAMLTAEGSREHIWFAPTRIDGDSFTGECSGRCSPPKAS